MPLSINDIVTHFKLTKTHYARILGRSRILIKGGTTRRKKKNDSVKTKKTAKAIKKERQDKIDDVNGLYPERTWIFPGNTKISKSSGADDFFHIYIIE